MMKILYSILFLVMALSFVSAEEMATYYLRDANGNVIAEYDGNGTLRHVNIYGLDLLGRVELTTNTILYKNDVEIGQFISLAAALAAIENDISNADAIDYLVSTVENAVLTNVSYSFNSTNIKSITIGGDNVVIDGESIIQISIIP